MNKAGKRKGAGLSILLSLLMAVGLGVLLYPTVSDQINKYRQQQTITDYIETTAAIDPELSRQMLEEAEAYNSRLARRTRMKALTDEEKEEYNKILDITKTGVMGYVEIPKIKVNHPIYHGTSEKVMQNAIGHIEGSSLPVGGESTHALISGHRGNPSARLFTDIDQLEKGDHFIIRVLDRILTYEVDQIRIVLPEELKKSEIVPGEDYCTLITCTPYGINTHRLLVRGTRVPNDEQEIEAAAGLQVNTLLMILLAAAPVLLFIVILLVIMAGRKRKNE